jgi:hypothetical protein
MRLKKTSRFQGRWLSRAVRGARPDRNPLRRGTDRLETCLLAGLFVAAAAGTPFAAEAASQAAFVNAQHVQQAQLATRHQVPATLTANAAPPSGYSLSVNVLTPATWTSIGGVRRSGEVPAAPGSLKGSVVPVWTDNTTGYLDSPPLTVAEVASQADAAMVGAIAGVAIVSLACAGAIRQLLNRRRMAAWEADWLATAPTWNRQSW